MAARFLLAGMVCAVLAASAPLVAAPPALKSGPQAGERVLPFTSNQVTGEQRGRQYCYVCSLTDETAVLVFARHTDEATGRLLADLRREVRERRAQKLFGWFVFLGADGTASETALEAQAYEFARKHGALALPISALGDPEGPPGYRIAPDADVTVVIFRERKVLYNRAYRTREWSARAAENALSDVEKWLKKPG